MTQALYTDIRRALGRATPGPWNWRQGELGEDSPDQWTLSPGILIAEETDGTPGGDDRDKANARLIILLRNNAEALLADAERWRMVAEPSDETVEAMALAIAKHHRADTDASWRASAVSALLALLALRNLAPDTTDEEDNES